MNRVVAAILTMLAALASTAVLAHEGHAHKIMGTVAAIGATHVEISTKEGKRESFMLTRETKYVRGKSPGLLAQVRIGERAVVSVTEKDGRKWVTEIRLADVSEAR